MIIKNFKNYTLNENILDDDYDENENRWEVKINNKTESYWEYKYDAIEHIVELLDTQGNEKSLEDYEDPEDNYTLSKYEIVDILFDLSEIDFYEKLDELKEYVGYFNDIKLVNLDDEDEIEFLD